MNQNNPQYARPVYSLVTLAIVLACVLAIPGCSAFKAKKKKDPFVDAPFTPEYSQIGWLWTGQNELPVPYVPREGDIILSSTIAPTQTILYKLIGNIGLPHHTMLVVKNSKGELGVFEVGAGSNKSVVIRPIELRLKKHKKDYKGSVITVRQIKRALTADESRKLTCFAESQLGKEFYKFRELSRLGRQGEPAERTSSSTDSWFCSQLVVHALAEIGLVKCLEDAGALVPEDIYHDTEYNFSGLWTKPTDWTYDQEATKVKPLRDPSRDEPKLLRRAR